MGFRFRKSFKVAPGIRLNVSRKSFGVSLGGKHGGMSLNSRNGARGRVSLGHGLTYSTKLGNGKGSSRSTKRLRGEPAAPAVKAPRPTSIEGVEKGSMQAALIISAIGVFVLWATKNAVGLIVCVAAVALAVCGVVMVYKDPEKTIAENRAYNEKNGISDEGLQDGAEEESK